MVIDGEARAEVMRFYQLRTEREAVTILRSVVDHGGRHKVRD